MSPNHCWTLANLFENEPDVPSVVFALVVAGSVSGKSVPPLIDSHHTVMFRDRIVDPYEAISPIGHPVQQQYVRAVVWTYRVADLDLAGVNLVVGKTF
jgi:hypothetical protein